jgi:hypothetical protein
MFVTAYYVAEIKAKTPERMVHFLQHCGLGLFCRQADKPTHIVIKKNPTDVTVSKKLNIRDWWFEYYISSKQLLSENTEITINWTNEPDSPCYSRSSSSSSSSDSSAKPSSESSSSSSSSSSAAKPLSESPSSSSSSSSESSRRSHRIMESSFYVKNTELYMPMKLPRKLGTFLASVSLHIFRLCKIKNRITINIVNV